MPNNPWKILQLHTNSIHVPFCRLQTPHLPISVPQISIGQSKNCNLCLKDQSVSKILCKLRRLEVHPCFQLCKPQLRSKNVWKIKHMFLIISLVLVYYFQQGGQCGLEVVGKKGMVQLNGRSIISGMKVPLTGGDEVVFGSCGKHAYVSFCHFFHSFMHSFHSLSFSLLLYMYTVFTSRLRRLSYICSLFFLYHLTDFSASFEQQSS
jgi:hypothetical protein